MAFMIIRHLARLGLRCPDDISVVGYDDDARCATFSPPVTTVRVPVYALAEQASRILLSHITTKQNSPIQGNTRVPVELIERGSVRLITR
jgi:DNA-binding LacI/PurR family transcriptional regulator